MDPLDNFQVIINHLKTRRGMYILESNSFYSLSNFINGYSIGILNETKKDIIKDFHSWLEIREGKRFSLNWASYILQIKCNNDDEKAIKLSLSLLSEFITNLKEHNLN